MELRRKHRDLRVWQAAVDLVEMVYRMTAAFPREEVYGLTAQMRRSAVSFPSNIAEGSARKGTRALLHFLSLASASLSELDTQLELARRIGLTRSDTTLDQKMEEVFALLISLEGSLRRRST
ncbi:MAG: four helix bundle protein [Burkholderiales bacterium]